MKYRILHNDELQHLEEELKQFLIVNGIHAEEWERINQEDPDLAIELVELFSDAVLQQVYEKLKYLELRSPNNLLVFYFGSKMAEVISITVKTGTTSDLSTPESIHRALSQETAQLLWTSSVRENLEHREKEIHQLLQSGAVASTEQFWKALKAALII